MKLRTTRAAVRVSIHMKRGKNMDNNQALGYMLLACQQLGYTKEQARKLYAAMYFAFDVKTEEEAEEKGFEWYHGLDD